MNQETIRSARLGGVILVIMVLVVGRAMAQHREPKKKPVYVIVHGAWGGSWAFRKVDSLMTGQASGSNT